MQIGQDCRKRVRIADLPALTEFGTEDADAKVFAPVLA